MAGELWIPGAAGPSQEDFVARLQGVVQQFAERRGIERPFVEVQLHDGLRVSLHSMRADPGFGFITLCPHPEEGPPPGGDQSPPPEELIVPVGSIVRIRLADAPEDDPGLGFSVPSA